MYTWLIINCLQVGIAFGVINYILHNMKSPVRISLSAFLPVVLFVAIVQLCPAGANAQAKDFAAHHVPYSLPIPTGWTTEEFPLPPDFAPSFTYKGIEDIRFHKGWGDSTSQGYWSYAYLWWLEGTVAINAADLKRNFEAYYNGLVRNNIISRKIPASKVVPTVATITKVKAVDNDKETFSGTITMLDYMAQRKMVLHCIVHVKATHVKDKTAVLVAVSPQPVSHAIWKDFDGLSIKLVTP
jgi:hypothetical protein